MRRSAGFSSAEGEPPDLVLFLDEDTSASRAVRALREAGASVEVHRDHFRPGTPDEDWLAVVEPP